MKFGLEVLRGKALSFYLNLSMKPVIKFFAYKCKLSLSLASLYLIDLFINKLKTKFKSFLQNYFKYKKNSQLLLKKFPARAKQMPSKVLFVSKKKATAAAFWSLSAKIVIVGNSKWVKIIIFVLSYLTVLAYNKTIIHLSVGG